MTDTIFASLLAEMDPPCDRLQHGHAYRVTVFAIPMCHAHPLLRVEPPHLCHRLNFYLRARLRRALSKVLHLSL